MNDIMKIVKSIKESDLLITGVSETTKNNAQEQRCGLPMLLDTLLGFSLLQNLKKIRSNKSR